MQLPRKGGKKVYIFGSGHMTKMAAVPIYGKTFKNLSIYTHWADCLETCCVSSGTLVLLFFSK